MVGEESGQYPLLGPQKENSGSDSPSASDESATLEFDETERKPIHARFLVLELL